MASGCWGLLEFRLGARGYLYYQPDWGVEDPEEEARAAGALDPETEALLRAEHEHHISGQILAAEIKARNADAVIAAQGEGAGDAEEKPAATLFVRRGAIFRRAEEAKLRPGEPGFVKEPSGAWAAVGLVDANAGLPEVTIL
jgi:hypothetical protein